MRLFLEPPLADLLSVVTDRDREWRTQRGLHVLWALPYTPNFLLFNRRRARLLGLHELGVMYEDEASWSGERFATYVRQLGDRLRQQEVVVVELAPMVPPLTVEWGSDGVHLGMGLVPQVFHKLMLAVLAVLPGIRPLRPIRVRTLAERWALRHRRTRHRRRGRAVSIYRPTRNLQLLGSTCIRDNVVEAARVLGHPL